MLEFIKRLMDGRPDGIPVKILTVNARRWRESHLLAADTTGAAFRTQTGVHFIPWSGLHGVVAGGQGSTFGPNQLSENDPID